MDPQGSALGSVIISRCGGKSSSVNQLVEWTEDVERNRSMTVVSQAGQVVTVGADDANLVIPNDILWDSVGGSYFRVVEVNTAGTGITLRVIGDNTETTTLPTGLATRVLYKYTTSFPEGARGGETYRDNPMTCKNTMTIFRDFVEVTDNMMAQNWHVEGYTYEQYELMKKMKKHKRDINNQLYIGRGYETTDLQMNKGLINYPILKNNHTQASAAIHSTTGNLLFTEDHLSEFMFNTVKRDCDAPKMLIMCNKGFLIYTDKLVRSSSGMRFDPLGQKDTTFGFNVKNFTHMSGDYEIIHDGTLDDLFPGRMVAFFLDPKKVKMRYLEDTKLTRDVGSGEDDLTKHKIKTVGGCLQLIQPTCHSMLNLALNGTVLQTA
jgi:hypothetical protein